MAKKLGCKMNKGIAIAGNILTDNVKIITTYPEKGMLATIEKESLAVGGAVPNTAMDIKNLDSSIDVTVYGRVGNDEKGKYVLSRMSEIGINVSKVKVSDKEPTSYSDVMTVKSTGERTFFHNRGANKEFCIDDINIDELNCDIFHIGYLMLLDYFDKLDENNKTPMAELLCAIQRKGIKTSIDLVSETSGNFKKVVSSALPYCDYVIINEIEAGNIAGVSPRDKDGSLIPNNIKFIMKELLSYGVKSKVIIHCPEMGFCLDSSGKYSVVPSRKLKNGFIKGSVGAGDAFCAGSLYSIYKGYDDVKMLEFANLVAINCLSQPDSVSGVCCAEELHKVFND